MSETNSLNSLEQITPPPQSTGNAAAKPIDAAGHALFERIGIGGMGEVYRCGDDALQRDLAIKILKAELRGDADAQERFLREARLTGSLQHPGVVPVHHLGRLADGRPCYTMKLVRGRTFADLLREEPEGPERLPRLLAVLEKICQAVAYAHSKQVIHRDLKPSNVMVGEFGEVQVMDWGLAKELSRAEPAPPAEATEAVETAAWTKEGEGLSRAGSALGTPAYMPPEQAAGDWDIVDERADVFALGAIMCEMLTGRPPYHGANRDDLLRRARRGDLAETLGRLEKGGADAVLVNLCRECLAAERLQRPRHAGVVAEQLASYQAEVRERLRQAELERARAEVKALEERKRRRLIAALALSALVLLAGGVAAWWQWQQRRIEADRVVAEALGEAQPLRAQARSEVLTAAGYDKVVAAAHHAVEMARAGGASQQMRRQADEWLADVQQEAEAAAHDRKLLAALLEVRSPREGQKFRRDNKDTMMALAEPTVEEQFASAFRAWGLDVDAAPPAEAVARLKARPAAMVTEVIAALDEWASQRRGDGRPKAEWQRLAELAAALDADSSSLRRELRNIVERGQLPLERALGLLSAALRPVPAAVEVPLGEDRRRLRRLADNIDPAAEPVLGLLTLTRALRVAGEEALAEHVLRAALTARPREVVLYHTLGQLLSEQKPPRWAEAVEFYRAARALRPDLGVTLAQALLHSDRDREGLALLSRMVRESPYDSYLHLQQGFALSGQGRQVEAEEPLRKAIALKPDYVEAFVVLGVALYGQGKYVEAEEPLRKAIGLEPDYAKLYYFLGCDLHCQRKHVEAEKPLRKAIALKPDYVEAFVVLGVALYAQEKYVEAEEPLRKAIALKPDHVEAFVALGGALYGQGKYVEAEEPLRKAVALKPDGAAAYGTLSYALYGQGKLEEAEAACRKAVELEPKGAIPHYYLGNHLWKKADLDGAEREYREAVRLDGDHHGAAIDQLAALLVSRANLDGAVAVYNEILRIDPMNGEARTGLAKAERLAAVQSKLAALLKGDFKPTTNAERLVLSELCTIKKLYRTSAGLYAGAFAADPRQAADLKAGHRYNAACHAALAAAGQGEDASWLPDNERSRLRRQALGWLRDDLTAYAKLAEQNNPAAKQTIQQRLAHWRSDPDLASVRDPRALERLPGDARTNWQALWRDVDKLAKRAAKKDEPSKGAQGADKTEPRQ